MIMVYVTADEMIDTSSGYLTVKKWVAWNLMGLVRSRFLKFTRVVVKVAELTLFTRIRSMTSTIFSSSLYTFSQCSTMETPTADQLRNLSKLENDGKRLTPFGDTIDPVANLMDTFNKLIILTRRFIQNIKTRTPNLELI